jgi:CTP synthase (UTP-ammonia lyase)
MRSLLNVGILGEYNPQKTSHPATLEAIGHAAGYLSVKTETTWLSTPSCLTEKGLQRLVDFDALWASSGGDYQSPPGLLKGIRRARELHKPFIGTCGGNQYTLLEYARNVAGMAQAGHQEDDPDTPMPLIVLAACPLDSLPAGAPRLTGGLKIKILSGTQAFRIYQQTEIEETFNCNYELNPQYQEKLEKAGLKVSGVSQEGHARIVELTDHKFYIGAGFLPQMSSTPGRPHPLIAAFLRAAIDS